MSLFRNWFCFNLMNFTRILTQALDKLRKYVAKQDLTGNKALVPS